MRMLSSTRRRHLMTMTKAAGRGTERGAAAGRRCCAPSAADHDLAALARALGHPARVAILRFLASKGSCVCGGIVSSLPLAQATVSQHLKMLKESGLVEGEIDGPRVCYCV